MKAKFIDLRSDTVTQPTQEMRELMACAEVGDDVYRDDFTVIRLEEMAAGMLGKEAGLFVPSGTFGNQVAILTHTKRGDEIIVGADSHILIHEVGAPALISGVQTRSMNICNNRIDAKELEEMIRTTDIHYPETGLICLENARSNGAVLPLEDMKGVYELAKKYNIPVHLDGARYFNAAKALGIKTDEMAKYADSVSICLSKGLCAPIGSILLGTRAFIERARKNRKIMGGGLRQAGVLAAPGIYALEHMVDRLEEDHANARYLAGALAEIPGVSVFDDQLDINMVFFKMPDSTLDSDTLVEGLYKRGIKINGSHGNTYRFVTHHGVDRKDIDYTLDSIKELLK